MDWHEANEAAMANTPAVMSYAHAEGLAPEGIAHAGYRMGYMAGVTSVTDAFVYTVVAEHGKDLPEATVGTYRTTFEAEAVANAWNKVNNKYGVTYRVETDW